MIGPDIGQIAQCASAAHPTRSPLLPRRSAKKSSEATKIDLPVNPSAERVVDGHGAVDGHHAELVRYQARADDAPAVRHA